MSGEYEKEIESKPKGKSTAKVDIGDSQKLRVHVSGGEVHFHDDGKNKIKAAIPVAVWFAAWEKLRTLQTASWEFLDAGNDSRLSIAWDTGSQDVVVVLAPEATGDTFKKLDLLTRGK